MIEPRHWMADVLARLRETFGPRLLYLGLQGSYRRGEATETSDIDLVVFLDRASLDDLDVYREVVHAMPEGHKACGFISGAGEIACWPRHELFQFSMDTEDHHGRLAEFLPPLAREDIREGARTGAASLLHLLTHSYLYAAAGEKPAVLKNAYKSAFFTMLVVHYLASGVYCGSKKDLLARLQGAERDIVAAGLDFPAWLAAHSEEQAFEMLIAWCRNVMAAS